MVWSCRLSHDGDWGENKASRNRFGSLSLAAFEFEGNKDTNRVKESQVMFVTVDHWQHDIGAGDLPGFWQWLILAKVKGNRDVDTVLDGFECFGVVVVVEAVCQVVVLAYPPNSSRRNMVRR